MESNSPSCSDAIMDAVTEWNLSGAWPEDTLFSLDSYSPIVPLQRSVIKTSLEPRFPGQIDLGIEDLKERQKILELTTRDESYVFPIKIKAEPQTIYDAANALLTLIRLYPFETGPARKEVVRVLSDAFKIPESKIYQAVDMLNDGKKIKIEKYTDETGKEDVRYINMMNNREKRLEQIYLHGLSR